MKKFIITILTAGLSFSLYSSQEAIARKSQVLGVMKNSKSYIQELQSALEENKQSMSKEAAIATGKNKIHNAMQKELDDLIHDYDRKTSILISVYGEEILHELNAFNPNEI
jgi:hypothetical protein